MKKNKLYKTIDNQVYEVDHAHKNIFDIAPGNKRKNLQTLKQFVMKECYKTWRTQPRELATLKREFLKELLDSLS